MTDEQLYALRRELDEVIALRQTTATTQQACNRLLEEGRAKDKRIRQLEAQVEALLRLIPEAKEEA